MNSVSEPRDYNAASKGPAILGSDGRSGMGRRQRQRYGVGLARQPLGRDGFDPVRVAGLGLGGRVQELIRGGGLEVAHVRNPDRVDPDDFVRALAPPQKVEAE